MIMATMSAVKLFISLSLFVQCCFTTSCPNAVPGVKKLIVGVDITQLDLFPLNRFQIGGMKSPVFDLTCNLEKKWTEPMSFTAYDQPDQVKMVISAAAGRKSASAKVFRSYQSVKKKMSAEVGVKGGYGGFGFSMSASYKQMQSSVTSSEKQIIDVTTHESAHLIKLLPLEDGNRLSSTFKLFMNKLKGLSYEGNKGQFKRFIEYFGTHYMRSGNFGGIVRKYIEISSSYSYGKTDRELKVQAEMSYSSIVGSAAVSAKFEGSTSKVDKQFSESTDSLTYYYGGDANLITPDGLNHWQPTVKNDPVLISMEVKPLYQLVTDRSIRYNLKTAINEYVMRSFLGEVELKLQNALIKYKEDSRLNRYVDEIKLHKKADILNIYELKAVDDEIVFHTEVPIWFSQHTKFCFKYAAENRGHESCNKRRITDPETLCSSPNTYTQQYYDHSIAGTDGGCELQWGILATRHPDWFDDAKVCLSYWSNVHWLWFHSDEKCADVNKFTPEFLDSSWEEGRLNMLRWKIEIPENSPLWLKYTRLCFEWHPGSTDAAEQCNGEFSQLCANVGSYTTYYTDATRYGFKEGCYMKWSWRLIES